MKSLGASLHLGAAVRDNGVAFRAWAPRCRTLDVVIEGRRPLAMSRQDDGLFEAVVAGLRPGTRYQYRLDGERYRPDPASRFQPEGVHGPSVAVNPGSFPWTDQAFAGYAAADLVIYELHVGTFTRAGTFEAIVPHLPHLVELGVTAVELMPVAEFPGSRNWGYDGVHLFAPQSTYGGPRGLRRLVDACHSRNLSVILDLVYNHLGPEGNYLAEFGPFFTDRYKTPWGEAADFTDPALLPRAVAEGFAFQGQGSEYFGGPRGTASADLPGEHFVIFVQNHDQVGNRAQSDRLWSIVRFEALKVAAALMFAAPGLPLLFMGEEYGETAPFQYFTSFLDRNLAEAVRRGRTLEFAKFAWQGQVVDPGDPATFVRSRLNHSLVGAPRHRALHHYYRRWLALRRDHPALGARHKSHAQASLDGQGVLTLVRRAPSGEGVYLLANLTAEPKPRNADPAARGIILDSADVQFAGPGRVTPLAPYQVQLYELTR